MIFADAKNCVDPLFLTTQNDMLKFGNYFITETPMPSPPELTETVVVAKKVQR